MPPNTINQPFVYVDASKVDSSVKDVIGKLEDLGQKAEDMLDLALAQVAEDILDEAQAKAPIDAGALRASGTTVGPTHEGDEVTVLIGFNIVYARIRDKGGDIRPVRAKALFIPLRKGVRPGQPGLTLGIDFQLVPGPMTNKDHVHQEGNGYLTQTFETRKPLVNAQIGQVLQAFLVDQGGA